MASHHDENRTLPSIDIVLEEAGNLLGLMTRGIRKVNSTITVYYKSGKIQVEDPADLLKDTLVPANARVFELETKAGTPYAERILVSCVGRGKVKVEVTASSEEWALGKLGIVTRFLLQRRKAPYLWFSRGLWIWLFIGAIAAVYRAEGLFVYANLSDSMPLLKVARSGYIRWFITGLAFLMVGRWLTGASILHIRPLPIYKRSLVWEFMIPLVCGFVANAIFQVCVRYLTR